MSAITTERRLTRLEILMAGLYVLILGMKAASLATAHGIP